MSEPDGWVMVCTQISVPRSRDDLTFLWQGGNIARLPRGNMGWLEFDPYGVLSNRDPQVGDVFTYGSYQVRCTVSNADYIEVIRID